MSQNYTVLGRNNLRTVCVGIMLPAGSSTEPHPGINRVLMNNLTRVTSRKSELELAEYLDANGISTSFTAGRNATVFLVRTIPRKVGDAIEILREMVFEPEFTQDIVDKIKENALSKISQLKSNPESVLSNYLRWESSYLDDPVTRHPLGEERSLKEIDNAKLDKWHDELINCSPIGVVVGKGMTITNARKQGFFDLLGSFGNKKGGGILVSGRKKPLNSVVHHHPAETSNTYFAVNFRTESSEELYYDSKIFRSIVGGGMSARLFHEIREVRNLSYAPRIRHSRFPGGTLSTTQMDVTPEKADEALVTTLNIIQDVLNKPISRDELERAVNMATNTSIFISDSSYSYASYILDRMSLGEEWDLEKVKDEIHMRKSSWQDKIRAQWLEENVSFAVSGSETDMVKTWKEKAEELVGGARF